MTGRHRTAPSRPLPTTGLAVLLAVVATLAACSSGDDAPAATTASTSTTVATTTTTEAALEAGEQIFVYVPEVGDCFDRRTLDSGEDVVLLLDCDLPHEAEVFATFEATEAEVAEAAGTTTTSTAPATEPAGEAPTTEDPGAAPGAGDPDAEDEAGDDGGAADEEEVPTIGSLERGLEDLARRRCPPLLGAYVGTPYELSELEVSWWVPTPEAWEEGQRRIACTLFDPTSDRLAGSQRDARR